MKGPALGRHTAAPLIGLEHRGTCLHSLVETTKLIYLSPQACLRQLLGQVVETPDLTGPMGSWP